MAYVNFKAKITFESLIIRSYFSEIISENAKNQKLELNDPIRTKWPPKILLVLSLIFYQAVPLENIKKNYIYI